MEAKTHKIQVKNYCVGAVKIDQQIGKKYSDIRTNFGSIDFTGTDEELSEFLKDCRKDEKYFKVIGVI